MNYFWLRNTILLTFSHACLKIVAIVNNFHYNGYHGKINVILAATVMLLKHLGCKKLVGNNFQKSEMKIEMGDQGQCYVKIEKNSYVKNKQPTR